MQHDYVTRLLYFFELHSEGTKCVKVRAHVEKQIDLIAHGKADKDAVVAHTLHQFSQKFAFFMANISKMDQLFEASFTPLASSGELIALLLSDTFLLTPYPCSKACGVLRRACRVWCMQIHLNFLLSHHIPLILTFTLES